MSYIARTIDAQSLALLAFNHPEFLANADGAVEMTVASFLDEAAWKWTQHTGLAPSATVLGAATVLLTGMAEYALVAVQEAREAENEAEDRRCYREEIWRWKAA